MSGWLMLSFTPSGIRHDFYRREEEQHARTIAARHAAEHGYVCYIVNAEQFKVGG